MTIERINGAGAVPALGDQAAATNATGAARTAMAAIGERVLAWTATSFGTGAAPAADWSARTGVTANGFTPDRAELARGGDVYALRELTAEVAGRFGATPAQEGALGRAVEDFARGVALHFNARAGGGNMVGDVATALGHAAGSQAGEGVEGVTARIETAARMVEDLNR